MTKRTFLFGNRPAVKAGGRFCYVLAMPFYNMVLVTSHKGTTIASAAMVANMKRSNNKMVRHSVATMGG